MTAFRSGRWFLLVALLLVAGLPSAHAQIDRSATSVVVYRCGEGFANLCSLVPETGAQRQLTFDGMPRSGTQPAHEYDAPSLAPDGKLLAFAFDQRPYIARADASARLLISDLQGVREEMSVRPDRRRIAVTTREEVCPSNDPCYWVSTLAVVDSQRRILLQFVRNWYGVWADRRLVVMYDGRDELWIRSPPRYRMARLLLASSGKLRFAEPAVSPDGRLLALRVLEVDGLRIRSRIWVLALATKKLRRVTNGPADSHPAWSPNGRRIVFSRGGGCSPIIRTRSRCDLHTVDLATGKVRNLGVRGAQPTWGRRS